MSSLRIAAIAAGALVLLVSSLHADEPDKAKPKTGRAPFAAGVLIERDIAYVPGGDAAQTLDLYLPEKPAEKPLPLIVHIHGGGWMGGSKYPCPVANMVSRGYAVASVEYRFSQKAKFPAQIQDCQAAIRFLRAKSKEYGLDSTKFGAVGGSAGGHLSALVGTAGGTKTFEPIGGNETESDAVQCVCDIFGPTNFATVMQQAAEDKNIRNIFKFNTPSDPYSSLIGGSLETEHEKTKGVSPITYVSQDSPPMLILHGTHDALVPYAQSTEFLAALKAKGVPAWLQTLPGSGHGGPAFTKSKVLVLMQNFFDKHLQGKDVAIELVPEAELAVEVK